MGASSIFRFNLGLRAAAGASAFHAAVAGSVADHDGAAGGAAGGVVVGGGGRLGGRRRHLRRKWVRRRPSRRWVQLPVKQILR